MFAEFEMDMNLFSVEYIKHEKIQVNILLGY